MAIKHSALTAPAGVAITGTLIHEVQTVNESHDIELMGNDGAFEDGKGLRKKTTHRTSGECLSTAALPSEGIGAATAASPRVTRVTETEKSENAADFVVEDHYYDDGSGDFAAVE